MQPAHRLLLGIALILQVHGRPSTFADEHDSNSPAISEITSPSGQIEAIEAGPLPTALLYRLQKVSQDSAANFEGVLQVVLDDAAAKSTPMAGSYKVGERSLRFTPRFAFRPGQAYRAVLNADSRSGLQPPAKTLEHRFQIAAPRPAAPTEVVAVYPSADVVPENLLRFYVHFSAPMARGQAYDHVQLLDEDQKVVELAFLEIGEEFWDPAQQRLTLLFDPGRIKRGLKPREDVGGALLSGKEYTLQVKSTWPDANAAPLKKTFAKTFRVGPPSEDALATADWKLSAPRAGSREPLVLEFPKPLDQALLQRMISVQTSVGKTIHGKVEVSNQERRWQFLPQDPWPAGKYVVVVDAALEDLAGNRIGRPFDLDTSKTAAEPLTFEATRLPFDVNSSAQK